MAWIVRCNIAGPARAAVLSYPRSREKRLAKGAGAGIVYSMTMGKSMQRRNALKRLALSAALAIAGIGVTSQALAADTIKVGVLHSLSGTMAISETVLKDVTDPSARWPVPDVVLLKPLRVGALLTSPNRGLRESRQSRWPRRRIR